MDATKKGRNLRLQLLNSANQSLVSSRPEILVTTVRLGQEIEWQMTLATHGNTWQLMATGERQHFEACTHRIAPQNNLLHVLHLLL